MTSASELFYNRRSRIGRSSADLGLDSPPSPSGRSFHHSPTAHGRRNLHRHDPDGCDPLRRYPHSRSSFSRLSVQERGSFRQEESTTQFAAGGRIDAEELIGAGRSPEPLNPSERLPGAVLLARARLRERLRGLPPAATRQHGRARLSFNSSGVGQSDGSSPFDANDWETEIFSGRWLTNGSPSTDSSYQNTRLRLLQEQNKNPVGLTQEALGCLRLERFSASKDAGFDKEQEVSRSARDCSICLESFSTGDELICLPCEHRFHAACLRPWVQIRGDCPYCRSIVDV